jgi:hypothetical protein
LRRANQDAERIFIMFKMAALLTILISLPVFAASGVAPGSRVFLAPMEGGLHGFLAPELIKQKVPFTLVTDENDADYILTGASIKADDKWYHAVFGGKDKNEGNVQLLSVRDRTVAWAGEAGDRSLLWGNLRRGGQRKIAERLVKGLKKSLFQ